MNDNNNNNNNMIIEPSCFDLRLKDLITQADKIEKKKKYFDHFQKPYILIHIHNWALQPFIQDYDLASHTSYSVCVNFIHDWRELQFKIDSER